MNKWSTAIASACMIGLLFVLPSAHGVATLPTLQTFEGGWAPDATTWVQSGSGTVGVDGSTAASGSQSAVISNDVLTVNVAGSPANAWFQIWAKPVVGATDPVVASGVSGAFYVKAGSGQLMAYTGAWTPVASGLPTSGSTWIGFVVHVDYVAQKWDIYYATPYTNKFTKANGAPLALVAGNAALTDIAVESGSKAFVDQWAVSKGFASVTASPATPGSVLTREISATAATEDYALPVYSDTYIGAGNNLLNGALGNDLMTGLDVNDQIWIYDTLPINKWDTYYITAGGAWAVHPSAPDSRGIGANPILPTTVMQLHRVAVSADSVGFYAYNNSAAVAFDGAKAPGVSYGMTLLLNQGWTPLNWPRPLASLNDISNFPVYGGGANANLATGDRLYKSTGQPGYYEEFWWNGSSWQYYVTQYNPPVPAGANMWIKRKNADQNMNVTL